MRIFLFILLATILEATGDAIVRISLQPNNSLPIRAALYAAGAILLALYGTSLNLAPVEFAKVTGFYVATLFIVFQITNFAFFRVIPTLPTVAGGLLIVTGGVIVGLWG